MSSVLNGLSCFEEAPVLERIGPTPEAFHDEAVKVAGGEGESPSDEETRWANALDVGSISRFSDTSTAESMARWLERVSEWMHRVVVRLNSCQITLMEMCRRGLMMAWWMNFQEL